VESQSSKVSSAAMRRSGTYGLGHAAIADPWRENAGGRPRKRRRSRFGRRRP
jgi:hypothetical protein